MQQSVAGAKYYGQFSRNDRSASYEESLLSALSEKQVKALIKMQAFSRGNTTRRSMNKDLREESISSKITDGSANDESQRLDSEDLRTTESFSKDYVDKLKAQLAAKSEDNKKLRASLSEQTPPATPHVRSKKDGKLSRFFQHFGRRSSGEIE